MTLAEVPSLNNRLWKANKPAKSLRDIEESRDFVNALRHTNQKVFITISLESDKSEEAGGFWVSGEAKNTILDNALTDLEENETAIRAELERL